MQYRNTKTGALIETACPVSGENWVEVKAPAKKSGKKVEGGENVEGSKDDAR